MKLARGAAFALLFAFTALAADTALDRYVKKPDATYKYEIVNTVRGEGYTTYVVDLTSQTWRTPSEVNRTVWKHWLTIVKPDRVATQHRLSVHHRRVGRAQGAASRGCRLHRDRRDHALRGGRVAGRTQRAAALRRRNAATAPRTASSPTPGSNS